MGRQAGCCNVSLGHGLFGYTCSNKSVVTMTECLPLICKCGDWHFSKTKEAEVLICQCKRCKRMYKVLKGKDTVCEGPVVLLPDSKVTEL